MRYSLPCIEGGNDFCAGSEKLAAFQSNGPCLQTSSDVRLVPDVKIAAKDCLGFFVITQ